MESTLEFAKKGPSSQSYGFSCSHIIWMWEVDHKESWAQKNCWRRRMTPFDWKIKPVNSQGNQSWLFIGRTDAEAETPILWPSDVKNGLTGKGPDAGKDWGQEEKGMTGWDGWMASLTLWTRVWASSGSWWWTGRPGVLYSMVLQRVRHQSDWTKLNSF